MTGLFNQDKLLKKNQLKDTQVFVLADGYDGYAYYADVDAYGHLQVNISDGYASRITSTDVSVKTGLDVYVLNPNSVTITPDGYLYAEDSQHTSGDLGRLALAVRNDSDAVLTSTDLDYSGTAVDAYGHGKIDLYDGYGYPQNKITSQSTTHATAPRRGLDTWTIKGTPQHFNGVVGTTATTLTPDSTTTAILISNPKTNANGVNLLVSFDSGISFFTIERGGQLSIETETSSFQIKGSSSNTDYEILVTRR